MRMKVIFWAMAAVIGLSWCLMAQARVDWQSGRYAYVTNEGDNNLLVVDLKSEKVVATLATSKIPHGLVFTREGKGYVNNRGEASLTVIDGISMTVLKSIPLPATSMQIALSPDGRTLAVGYKDALLVSFIDTASDRIVGSVTIGPDRQGEKIVRIKHPFWSADGLFVYAGDDLNQTVVKIDARTMKVAATLQLHATTHHIVADPTGRYLYVCQGKGKNGALTVTILDAATDQVVKSIDISMAPGEKAMGHHGAFSPDGAGFYFCNEGGRTLAIIDTATMTVKKTLQVGAGAGHTLFSKDGARAFVICHDDNVVSVIDTRSEEVIRNIPVGDGRKQGHSGYMAGDGSFYMLNAADGTLNRIDTGSMTMKSQIKVGRNPMIMAVL